MQPPALSALQRRQHGCYTRQQGIELGLPGSTSDGRLARGHLRAPWPGVYVDAGSPRTWEQLAMAAVLHVGGDALLSRTSAARLHRVLHASDIGPDPVHVLVADRVFPRTRGIVVHRSRRFHLTTPSERDSIPVTDLAWTLTDLASSVHPAVLRRAVGAAVRSAGVEQATAARACLALRGPIPGARRLRALLDELSPLEAACRGEFESRFLRLMRGAGLEPTAMNHPVVDARGQRREIDAVWLPEHLPVELHSRQWHGSDLDVHDDLERENDIVLAGPWRTFLRFSWHDVTERGEAVVARVRAALSAARAGPTPNA